MRSLGYSGVFAPKYSETYPPSHRTPPPRYHGAPSDGCALFTKDDRCLLGSRSLFRVAAKQPALEGSSQVVIIGEIRGVSTGTHLATVCVCHLKAGCKDPVARRTRRQQCQVMIEQLKLWPAPYIVCGDLNEDMAETDEEGGVRHLCRQLQLVCAYAAAGHTPPYTWLESRSRAQLDYILVPKGAPVDRVWSIPEEALAKPKPFVPLIPSERYPSDHLALAVELSLPLPS